MERWTRSMENMVDDRMFWNGKSVLLTGHTGFKGSWLTLWLSKMGAHVHGFALEAPTDPNLFSVADLRGRLASHTIGDVRDVNLMRSTITTVRPEIVFHMAAQPLVRYSYEAPVETYTTNILGTINLFEGMRKCDSVRAIVNITTDKCYENRERLLPYGENEPMGGHDPYSCSKACAELITSSYRDAFFENADIRLASARAGNVIGGGDWGKDRLVPDFFRALNAGENFLVRSPRAIRPWQHVLEPLSGYLTLAEKLFTDGARYAEAWNFGPVNSDVYSVEWVVDYLCQRTSGIEWLLDERPQLHESEILKLDISKAKSLLGWAPRWTLETALQSIVDWHQSFEQGDDVGDTCLQQIESYESMKEA